MTLTEVKVMSRNRDFDYLHTVLHPETKRVDSGTYSMKNGHLHLDTCAGVDADCIVENNNHPINAFSSEEPYYYYKTALLAKWLEQSEQYDP